MEPQITFLMLHRLTLKVTTFQLPPPKRLDTVAKNILGGLSFQRSGWTESNFQNQLKNSPHKINRGNLKLKFTCIVISLPLPLTVFTLEII